LARVRTGLVLMGSGRPEEIGLPIVTRSVSEGRAHCRITSLTFTLSFSVTRPQSDYRRRSARSAG